jgi:glycosyltransferase involved in cell wall biosynthesis
MQRYALEVAGRLGNRLHHLEPGAWARGASGHLWEQLHLPVAARGSLLWSPVSTGPVAFSRQVCTIHDLIPIDHPEWFDRRFAQWYGWILPRVAGISQHIIAVSSFTKLRIVERFNIPHDRVSVILNGVDQSFLYPRSEQEHEELRTEMGIQGPYVLFLGSVEPRKNLNRLIDAWTAIRNRIPADTTLLIVGLPENPKIHSRVLFGAVPNSIKFVGYVDQQKLPVLYSGAAAFVYPTLCEGFGLPVLEAMACGAPVLTSGSTSLPEVAGNAALLVDPLSTDEIGLGLVRLLGDHTLRERLRTLGLARAAQLTWEKGAGDTWAILEREAGR